MEAKTEYMAARNASVREGWRAVREGWRAVDAARVGRYDAALRADARRDLRRAGGRLERAMREMEAVGAGWDSRLTTALNAVEAWLNRLAHALLDEGLLDKEGTKHASSVLEEDHTDCPGHRSEARWWMRECRE